MGVPAHDERDFEFAKSITRLFVLSLAPKVLASKAEDLTEAYVEEGV